MAVSLKSNVSLLTAPKVLHGGIKAKLGFISKNGIVDVRDLASNYVAEVQSKADYRSFFSGVFSDFQGKTNEQFRSSGRREEGDV